MDRHVHRELAVHGIAFCITAAIGAAVLSRYYSIFERDADIASQAQDAFLTCVVISGGVGPAITSAFFWLRHFARSRRRQFETFQNMLD